MNLDVTPIITSLLDTDAYKLHMQQAVFHRYNQVPVVAEFRCRSSDILGAYANEIEQQIQLMAQLSLSDDEHQYLRTLPFFTEDYLSWLKTFRFNPQQVAVSTAEDGQLAIRISGPWREVIMWKYRYSPLLAKLSSAIDTRTSHLMMR